MKWVSILLLAVVKMPHLENVSWQRSTSSSFWKISSQILQ